MRWAMEEECQRMCEAGHPCWIGLLSQWWQAFGCFRLKHLKRSMLQRLSGSFLHCHCRRGKQKHRSSGFDFALPAVFMNGFVWTEPFMAAWKKMPAARQQTVGMVFEVGSFEALAAESCTAMARAAVGTAVANPEAVSTYS